MIALSLSLGSLVVARGWPSGGTDTKRITARVVQRTSSRKRTMCSMWCVGDLALATSQSNHQSKRSIVGSLTHSTDKLNSIRCVWIIERVVDCRAIVLLCLQELLDDICRVLDSRVPFDFGIHSCVINSGPELRIVQGTNGSRIDSNHRRR